MPSYTTCGYTPQYFRNSDTDIIMYAPIALRAIGANHCAHIVQSAISVLAPFPSTQDERAEVLDGLDSERCEGLELLDSGFMSYPDDLTSLLFDFVARHPKVFGPTPKLA